MPTKRRKMHARRIDISPEAIAAWQAGDYWRLWSLLNLRPWQMPMWDEDPVEGDDRPEYLRRAHPAPDPRELKPMLLELGGPPGRWWFNEEERDAD
jgi:hypothetical protein